MRPAQVRSKRRSGVSPVVAEVCLIGVLLVATIMLSGIVYGAMTYYYAPPEVAAQATACTASGGSEVCKFTLSNIGVSGVSTDGVCSMSVGGSDVEGTLQNGGIVPAGGTLSGVACVVAGSIASTGSQIAGSIALDDGALVYFAAMAD